jgi:hypothetical protein
MILGSPKSGSCRNQRSQYSVPPRQGHREGDGEGWSITLDIKLKFILGELPEVGSGSWPSGTDWGTAQRTPQKPQGRFSLDLKLLPGPDFMLGSPAFSIVMRSRGYIWYESGLMHP